VDFGVIDVRLGFRALELVRIIICDLHAKFGVILECFDMIQTRSSKFESLKKGFDRQIIVLILFDVILGPDQVRVMYWDWLV